MASEKRISRSIWATVCERACAFAAHIHPRADARDDQRSGTPAPSGQTRIESTRGGRSWPARLRAALHLRDPARSLPPIRARAPGEVYPGQFIEGAYTNHAGTRAYKLYIPSAYRGQALPLIVMLHGCTQNPDDFAAGTRMNALAEKRLFFVVYPAQASAANQNKCWNWFKPSDQQRGGGEPSIIAGITREIVTTYAVDVRRVYIAGMSAGGAMAAIMGACYPDLYAAIGVHSGLAYGAARDLPSAFAAMRGSAVHARPSSNRPLSARTRDRAVPTIVFHGDSDATVHPRNGDLVLVQGANAEDGRDTEAAAKLKVTVDQGRVPDGRAYSRSIYLDATGDAVLEQWLIHGAGHTWSGGSPDGSYTDSKGPDASQEMVNFFFKHSQSGRLWSRPASSLKRDSGGPR
jgi:poly(hydroxyalkanoate) depolymerase family esterase